MLLRQSESVAHRCCNFSAKLRLLVAADLVIVLRHVAARAVPEPKLVHALGTVGAVAEVGISKSPETVEPLLFDAAL